MKAEYPEDDSSSVDNSEDRKNELNYDQSHIFILLKYILRKVAYEYQVAPRLIAEKQDLLNFILGKTHRLNKNDWRYEIFGSKAIDFLNGKVNFSSKDGKLFFIHV